MRIQLTCFLLFGVFSAIGQGIILKGTIYGDSKDNPLSFANIAILATSHGTISDDKGFFSLSASPRDSISISYVGYQSTTIAVADFQNFVILNSQPQQLNAVEISSSRKLMQRTYGFHKQKPSDYFAGPLQYAMLIKNTEGNEGVIRQLNFKVSHAVGRKKSHKKYSQVRIRVYAVDLKRGRPGLDLLRQNLIVSVSPGEKMITADVSHLSVPFPKEGVFIGIDVLGYLENNNLVNYYVQDAKRHLQIPFVRNDDQPITYINPTGKRWSLMESFPQHGKSRPSTPNACFGVIVEY